MLLVFSFSACDNTSSVNAALQKASLLDGGGANMQPTVVYLVRHAEKDTSDPANQDPDLTAQGNARAEALRTALEGQQIAALYATKYVRTKNTLKPLAEKYKLALKEYEAHDFTSLKKQIMENHRGQTVVVAGHSNTLLPIIEAFGAKRPVPDISDSQYSYLFKLTAAPDGTAKVETRQFGAESK